MYLNFHVFIGLVGKRNTSEYNSLWASSLQGTRLQILPCLLHFLKVSWYAMVKISYASDEPLKGVLLIYRGGVIWDIQLEKERQW